MTPNLNKILRVLVKELTVQVTYEVTKQVRESYVSDVTAIVKECINNSDIKLASNGGWITIEDCATKYHLSRKTVGFKCKLFGIKRKQLGKHKLLNEEQFLEAHNKPMEKPKFLNFLKTSQLD